MTDETLFSGNNTPSAVDQLVGDGKKFKTIEDLAKSKIEADAFIQRLQDENKGIREDLNTRVRSEELLEALEAKLIEGSHTPDNNQNRSETPTPDIEQLIEQKISKREAEAKRAENRRLVTDTLKKYFGDDFKDKLSNRTKGLEMTDEQLNNLVDNNPAAFLKLIGVTGQSEVQPMFTPPTSSTQHFVTPNTGGTRNYKHYSDLRKSDPTTYWKPEVQLQMHKDAIAAANRGEDFYK